jgi:prepilin-type processing-associated H-X9-DG protein
MTYYVGTFGGKDFPTNATFQGYSGAPRPNADLDWDKYIKLNSSQIVIDAGRHLKSGVARDKMLGMNGINALFADGHAATINVRDAWAAMLYPGTGKK